MKAGAILSVGVAVLAVASFPSRAVRAKVILLDSVPPGAEIYMDGSALYRGLRLENAGVPLTTPIPYDLPLGNRRLLFVKPGHAAEIVRLNVCDAPDCPDQTLVTLWPRSPEIYSLAENQVADGSAIPPSGASGQAFLRIEDWNSDGRPDLCMGNCLSQGMYYFPTNEVRDTDFGSPVQVSIPLPGPMTLPCPRPFVVDWNNDALVDTVFGLETGAIVIALASAGNASAAGYTPIYSSDNYPQFATYMNGGTPTPIASGTKAIPWVLDADLNGAKDLLVGNFQGDLALYANIGADAMPVLGPPEPFGPELRPWICSGGTEGGQCCAGDPSACVEGGGACAVGTAEISDYVMADFSYDGALDLIVAYSAANACVPSPGLWIYGSDAGSSPPTFYPTPWEFRFQVGGGETRTLNDQAAICPPPWSLSLTDVADADRTRARELFVGCGMGQLLQFRPVEMPGDLNGDRLINGLDIIEANLRLGATEGSSVYRALSDVPGWRNADGSTPPPPPRSADPLPGEEFTRFHRDGAITFEDRNRVARAFGRTLSPCGNGRIDGACSDNGADCHAGADGLLGTPDDFRDDCASPSAALCLAAGRCDDNGAGCDSGPDAIYGTADDDRTACAEPANASCVGGEECDDGNLVDNDGCSSLCLDERLDTALSQGCGNGLPDLDEVCDDGVLNGLPCYCNLFCTAFTPPVCGDGKLCVDEYCDEGETTAAGECDSTCTGPGNGQPLPICGDGFLDFGETCDDGALNGTTPCGCRTDCLPVASGSPCGGSAADCDALDVCDGAGNCLDAKDPAGAVCRLGSGDLCDPDELCDGVSDACPADARQPGGWICRAAGESAACDPAETCSGMPGEACPADAAAAAGTPCGSGTDGECDHPDTCDGLGVCQVNREPDGTACTDDGLYCTGAEGCQDGACFSPGDPCAPVACDEANDVCVGCGDGVVSAGEECDDGAANGTTSCGCRTNCQWASASTVCRPAAGGCDLPENCTGGGDCSPDVRQSAGTVCNPGSGDVCDPNEVCDGLSADCPSDGFASAGTTCRPAADLCDAEEGCPGVADAACPPDGKLASGSICRADADGGGCDAEETCDGVADACPADACETAGTLCSPPSGGLCSAACTCGALCDGSAASIDCASDIDCAVCADAGECWVPTCIGYTPPQADEFTVCANNAVAQGRCVNSTCTGDDGSTQPTSVGTDCSDADLASGSLGMSQIFTVVAAGSFKIWLRVLFDADWEGEIYNCLMDGSLPFTFTEAGLDSGAYGVNCTANAAGNGCWAAAFNNTAQALGAGNHTISCGFAAVAGGTGADTAGFDGLIVTNLATFIPSPGEGVGGTGLCDADANFTAGVCGGNWGPIRTPSPEGMGECNANVPEGFGIPCGSSADTACDNPDTCDGAGLCQPNQQIPGSLCGAPPTACNPWDTCDAAGNCLPTFDPPGAVCGGAYAEPICDPDGCDGAGLCVDQPVAPNGTPCGGASTCQSGICQ